MKLAVLGEGSTGSLLLQHHEINILLDCSAEPTLTALPSSQQQGQWQQDSTNQLDVCLRVPNLQRAVQTQELHAVLMTNPHALLAVPYLQQLLHQQGSRLPLHVYCTEPCYHGFQHLSQELLQLQRHLKQQQQQGLQQQPMPQQLQLYQQQRQVFSQQLLAQPQQHIPMLHNAALTMHPQQPLGALGNWQPLHQQQQQQQGVFVPAMPPPRPPPITPHQPPDGPVSSLISATCIKAATADTGTAISPANAPAAAAAGGSGWSIPPPRPPPVRPPAPPANPPATTVVLAAATAAAAAAEGFVPPPCPPPIRPPQPPPAPVLPELQGSTAAAAAETPAMASPAADLVPLFSEQQVEAVLTAVQIVRFGQRVQLPGCWGLTVEARPTGSSIGSAMWLLTAGSQRIAYLSPASLYPSHSAALHKPSLQNLDALIVAPGSLCPDVPCIGGGGDQLLHSAVAAAVRTVLTGGKVLAPVLPSGSAVLQLLEAIPRALNNTANPAAAAAAVRFFYLSPAAADALATASSCCEYLEPARKQAVLIYGQAPFEHDRLLQSGQLTILDSSDTVGKTLDTSTAAAAAAMNCSQMGANPAAAAELAAASGDAALQDVLAADGPCVVFVPLWSMAAGPGQQLAQQWCRNPNNLLLLPEQGPISATWLQQCMQLQLLPAPQHTQWQELYRPVNSTAAAAAAAGTGGSPSTAGCGSYPAVDGCLTAKQMLQLLLAVRQQQQQQQQQIGGAADKQLLLLLGARDRQLLESAAQADWVHLSRCCSLITLLSSSSGPAPAPPGAGSSSSSSRPLSFQLVNMPDPLLEIQLSRDLAKSLQLTPLIPLTSNRAAAAAVQLTSPAAGSTTPPAAVQRSTLSSTGQEVQAVQPSVQAVQPSGSTNHTAPGFQVSAARVRALLTHQAGVWRLEPLPGGTKPEAVAAVMDLQQQGEAGMMVFGSVELTTLLGCLQDAGLSSVYLDSTTVSGENSSADVLRVVKLSTSEGDAEIWLLPGRTELVCDSWSLRKQLLDVLMKQLHVIK